MFVPSINFWEVMFVGLWFGKCRMDSKMRQCHWSFANFLEDQTQLSEITLEPSCPKTLVECSASLTPTEQLTLLLVTRVAVSLSSSGSEIFPGESGDTDNLSPFSPRERQLILNPFSPSAPHPPSNKQLWKQAALLIFIFTWRRSIYLQHKHTHTCMHTSKRDEI